MTRSVPKRCLAEITFDNRCNCFTPANAGPQVISEASRPPISVGFMTMALIRPVRVRSKSVTLLSGGFIMGVA